MILGKVKKSFNDEPIFSIGFKFLNNKTYLIKGKSGCGKSTFLNILSGIDKSFSGEIDYGDLNLQNDIFYVYQENEFFSDYSIREFLDLFRITYESKLDIDSLLEEFDLLDASDSKYNYLSNGEKKRFLFILTLIKNPYLIIMDEPYADLDDENKEVITKYLNSFRGNHIVIITSHIDIPDLIIDKEFTFNDLNWTDDEKEEEHQFILRNPKNIISKRVKTNSLIGLFISFLLIIICIPFICETNGDYFAREVKESNSKIALLDTYLIDIEKNLKGKDVIGLERFSLNDLTYNGGYHLKPTGYKTSNKNLVKNDEVILSDLAALMLYCRDDSNIDEYDFTLKLIDYSLGQNLKNKYVTIEDKNYYVKDIVPTYGYKFFDDYIDSFGQIPSLKSTELSLCNFAVFSSEIELKNVNAIYVGNMNGDLKKFINEITPFSDLHRVTITQQYSNWGDTDLQRGIVKIMMYIIFALSNISFIVFTFIYSKHYKEEFDKKIKLCDVFFFSKKDSAKEIYFKTIKYENIVLLGMLAAGIIIPFLLNFILKFVCLNGLFSLISLVYIGLVLLVNILIFRKKTGNYD